VSRGRHSGKGEIRKEMGVHNYEVILKFLFVATNTERSDEV
jgi:hypothetical protein